MTKIGRTRVHVLTPYGRIEQYTKESGSATDGFASSWIETDQMRSDRIVRDKLLTAISLRGWSPHMTSARRPLAEVLTIAEALGIDLPEGYEPPHQHRASCYQYGNGRDLMCGHP